MDIFLQEMTTTNSVRSDDWSKYLTLNQANVGTMLVFYVFSPQEGLNPKKVMPAENAETREARLATDFLADMMVKGTGGTGGLKLQMPEWQKKIHHNKPVWKETKSI